MEEANIKTTIGVNVSQHMSTVCANF